MCGCGDTVCGGTVPPTVLCDSRSPYFHLCFVECPFWVPWVRIRTSQQPNSLFVFPRAQEHTLPICFVCTSPRPMHTSHDESTRQRRVHTLPNCPHTVHRWSQCPKAGQAPIVFRQFVKNRLPVGLSNPLESYLASFVRACSAAPGRRAFGKSSVKQIKNMEWMGSTGYQKQGTYVDICMGVQEQALAHGS